MTTPSPSAPTPAGTTPTQGARFRFWPWIVGLALLTTVIAVASNLAEPRELLRILAHAEPAWLLVAAALQVLTYFAEGENWRVVTRAAHTHVPILTTWRLSLAKLFVDQALPSAGISGTAVIARGLEREGVPRPVVMAAVVIDATSYYFAYVLSLLAAMAIVIATGHATPLVIALAVLIAVIGLGIASFALVIAGRSVGPHHFMHRVPVLRVGLRLLAEADTRLAHRARLHVEATLWQLGTVLLDALTMWLLLRSVGAPAPLPLVFASFMVSTLLRTVSIIPAGLGPFEAASVATLTLADVPITAALSATLLFRGLSFWLPLVPGLLFARHATRGEAATRHDGPDAWWSLPVQDVLAHLDASPAGLTSAEAATRLRRHGPNTVVERRSLSVWSVLWSQLRSPLLLLLVFAAATSALTGEWVDAAIILTILLASVGVGFAREYRAQSAAHALLAKVHTQARVLRDGAPLSVPVHELVPGDVVVLGAGNLVPADALLLDTTDLYVNEAVLTGESFPVDKRPGVLAPDTPLDRRTNAVFLGSSVRGGTARALVVATGRDTSFGDIAHRLTLRPPETSFERGVRRFGHLLTIAMLVMVIVVFAVNTLAGRPPIETLLFSIALAVGLSPELLPVILSVNLARSAQRMAQHGVLVKRLSAIENLGSMDVLCTDKTGTLTEGLVRLAGSFDPFGAPDDATLELAATNATLQAGLANALDEAIVAARPTLAAPFGPPTKVAEVPYDFVRKRLSVVVEDTRGLRLVTKGAVDHVLEVCAAVRTPAGDHPLDEAARAALRERVDGWSREGIRVLAVAERALDPGPTYGRELEAELTLAGFLTFEDRPKPGVAETVATLERLGVRLKLISGDARLVALHVASEVGMRTHRVLTGADLDALHDDALLQAAEDADLFVEVDPNQKERIILALKKMGHVVGFLGDGINDAPAMHSADTSLSVEDAVDVAKEAADFVLLEQDLDVIRLGIEEGRRTFANTLKYVLTTTSANLGNMVSMAIASLFLPFLPLLAGQVLLNNFLSDIPAIGIASDTVDPELVDRPRRWDMRFILRFMLQFGLVSSLFDLLCFGALLGLFAAPAELFRTGWFVESLLTELVIALVVRTRRPFFRSRPGRFLLWATLALVAFTLLLPYVPGAGVLGFVPLPLLVVATLLGITLLYMVAVELLKARFYRHATAA